MRPTVRMRSGVPTEDPPNFKTFSRARAIGAFYVCARVAPGDRAATREPARGSSCAGQTFLPGERDWPMNDGWLACCYVRCSLPAACEPSPKRGGATLPAPAVGAYPRSGAGRCVARGPSLRQLPVASAAQGCAPAVRAITDLVAESLRRNRVADDQSAICTLIALLHAIGKSAPGIEPPLWYGS
jgi:hypothetical protein